MFLSLFRYCFNLFNVSSLSISLINSSYICELETVNIFVFSSQMKKKDFILEIYKDKRTVFRLSDIAMLFPQEKIRYMSDRLGYYVQTGRLLNPRKGIYAKPDYNPPELANLLYAPSYISLEYVLQRAGIIFQYDSRYTCVSYISRTLEVDGRTYVYRRIKEEIIMNTTGVRNQDNINIATPERALLDMLYLNKDYYFDNLNLIDKQLISGVVPIYKSAALKKRVAKLFENG